MSREAVQLCKAAERQNYPLLPDAEERPLRAKVRPPSFGSLWEAKPLQHLLTSITSMFPTPAGDMACSGGDPSLHGSVALVLTRGPPPPHNILNASASAQDSVALHPCGEW